MERTARQPHLNNILTVFSTPPKDIFCSSDPSASTSVDLAVVFKYATIKINWFTDWLTNSGFPGPLHRAPKKSWICSVEDHDRQAIASMKFFSHDSPNPYSNRKRTCSHPDISLPLRPNVTVDSWHTATLLNNLYATHGCVVCFQLLIVPFHSPRAGIGISGYIDVNLYCQLQDCDSNVAT